MANVNWDDFEPTNVRESGVSSLVSAITHVESGGDTEATSPQGARGSMQIMPATFKQYAKQGEDYANDGDRRAAAIRKLQDDYKYYGGDIEKTAAAYIGGRGAVRSDGTIRDDVADSLGTTPVKYAQMVTGRIEKNANSKPSVNWDDFTPVKATESDVNWDDFTPVKATESDVNWNDFKPVDKSTIGATPSKTYKRESSDFDLTGNTQEFGSQTIDTSSNKKSLLAERIPDIGGNFDPMLNPKFVEDFKQELAQMPIENRLNALMAYAKTDQSVYGRAARVILAGEEYKNKKVTESGKQEAMELLKNAKPVAPKFGNGPSKAPAFPEANPNFFETIDGVTPKTIAEANQLAMGIEKIRDESSTPNARYEAKKAFNKEADDKTKAYDQSLPSAIRGYLKGGRQAVALAQGSIGLIGELTGNNSIKEWGLESYKENSDRAQNYSVAKNFTDINSASDAAGWVAENSGYVAFQAAQALLSAGLGGIIGETVGKKALGSSVGMAVANGAQTFGSVYGEAVDEAIKTGNEVDMQKVLIGATASMAIDTLADKMGLDALTAKAFKGNALTRVAKATGLHLSVQGGTEAAQLIPEEFGAGRDPFRKGMLNQYINEAAVGALGGVGPAIAQSVNRAPINPQITPADIVAPTITTVDQAIATAQASVTKPVSDSVNDIVSAYQQESESAVSKIDAILSQKASSDQQLIEQIRATVPAETIALNAINTPDALITEAQNAPSQAATQAQAIEAGAPARVAPEGQSSVTISPRADVLEAARVTPSEETNANTYQTSIDSGLNANNSTTATGIPVSNDGVMPAARVEPVIQNQPASVSVLSEKDLRLVPVSQRVASESNTSPTTKEPLTQPQRQQIYTATEQQLEALYQQDVKDAINQRLGRAIPDVSKAGRTPFKSFLREHGINSSVASDVTGERGIRANARLPATFRKNGLNLDLLAERAVEAGFMTQAELDSADDNGGTNRLVQMIQAEISGKSQETLQTSNESTESQSERIQRAEIEGMADKLGLPYDGEISTDRLASMVKRVNDRLESENLKSWGETKGGKALGRYKADRVLQYAKSEVARIERKRVQYERELEGFAESSIKVQDALLDVLVNADGNFAIVRQADIQAESAWNELNGQWEDQNGQTETTTNRTAQETSTPDNQGTRTSAENAREGSTEAQQGRDAEEGLTAPTRDDILAQQDRAAESEKAQAAADKAKEKAAKEAADKKEIDARQDASAENFQLGQSAEDSLSGQASMFDVPADKPASSMSVQDLLRAAAQKMDDAAKPQESQQKQPVEVESISNTATKTVAKIEDSGAVLEGARKLYAKAYADKLGEGMKMDLAAVPLSKSWPEPDYQRMLDDGADPWAVAFAHAARDEVPTKPSASWKLRGWVNKVSMLRDFTANVIDGKFEKDTIITKATESLGNWLNKIDLYEAVGHGTSLKDMTFHHAEYSFIAGQELRTPRMQWSINKGHWGNIVATDNTKAGSIEKFKEWMSTQEAAPTAKAATSFDIYSRTGKPGFIIGKRAGVKTIDLKTFDTVKEAREYKNNNQAELEKLLSEAKFIPNERRDTNAPRVGEDHRNGADVTTEQFREAFGFRGEQFGASMPQAERQANMNQAYDALMDLAGVIGIPPKALSLNGELGLAFGARGHGGKNPFAAHYEADSTGEVTANRVVINLTRKNGAGSLAHEWFHAVDNYFARMQGQQSGFMTERIVQDDRVRREMKDAFKDLMKAINLTSIKERSKTLDKLKTKDYWSTGLEMAARSFESYVIAKLQDQNGSNDYLANITSEAEWKKENGYPYPTAGEIPAIRAAFDNFFQVVQTKETDKGVAMFSRGESTSTNTSVTSTDQSDAIGLNRTMARYFNDTTWNNAYEQVDLPDSLNDFAAAASAAFDARIVAVRPTGAEFDQFNGINVNGTNFINVDANVSFINTTGHEISHDIEKNRPDLYAWFKEQARSYYKDFDSYQNSLNARVSKNEKAYTREAAESELLADAMGDALADTKFLEQLAQDNPSKFKDLLRHVIAWLKNASSNFSKKDLGSSKYFTDVEALRKHLNQVLLAYASNTPIERMEAMKAPEFSREQATSNQDERSADESRPGTAIDEVFPAQSVRPLNRVEDKAKLNALTDSMMVNGWTGRPVLAWKKNGIVQALTGSHRIAAARKANIDVPVVFVNKESAKWDDPNGLFSTFQDAINNQRQSNFLRAAGDKRAADLADAEDRDYGWESKSNESTAPDSDGVKYSSSKPLQTDTPAFKAWFGDSKVIDAEGKPLVMYHGAVLQNSNDGISIFREGTHFGDSNQAGVAQADSERYQSIKRPDLTLTQSTYPVYLSIKNPKRMRDIEDGWSDSVKTAKREGFDGIVYKNAYEGDGDSWISFNPEQIKSAIGNNGNFDASNPDIRFSRNAPDAVPANSPAIKQSPWLDSTGRLKFAPGQVAYDMIGKAINPILIRTQMKMANPKLRQQLRDMKLDVQKAQELAVAVTNESMKLSDGDRLMVSDIIEKELKSGVTPPVHAVQLAVIMNAEMSRQSQELIRLGMLSPDVASRLDGEYLPRFYESKLTKKGGDLWADAIGKLHGKTSSMKGIKGKSLHGRGMYKTIPESQLKAFEQLGWEVRDPDYNPSLPTMDGQIQVWRDYTQKEREDMGEIRDAGFRFVMGYMQSQKDIALGRMFEGMAKDPESSSRLAQDGWVKVPETKIDGTGAKRYGMLAGRYVPQETMSHLSQIEETQSEAWQMYRKAMGLWKEGKTVLNPGSHVNNIVSNLTMAHLAGVSYHRADSYMGAMKDFMAKAPMLKEANDAGLFLGSMSDSELMSVLPDELKLLVLKGESTGLRGVKFVYNAMTFFLRKPLGKAYQAEDTFFRYLLYKDARQRGASPSDSIEKAQAAIFTYDDLPKGARMIRDFGIPFFAYTYKAAPMLLHTSLVYPHRMLAPMAIGVLANAAAYALAFGDDDDDWMEKLQKYATDSEHRKKVQAQEESEEKNLPSWMRGSVWLPAWTKKYIGVTMPKAIRLGVDEVTGMPLFLDVSRLFPGGDLMDVHANVKGALPIPQPITPSHPILSMLGGLMANKDLFTGKELIDLNDDGEESTKKRLDWLWRNLSPAITIGNAHWERGMSAIAQASGGEITWIPDAIGGNATGIGKDGNPVQPKYAIMQTFGIKVRPIDLDITEKFNNNDKKALLRSLDMEIKKQRDHFGMDAINDKTFEAETDKLNLKKERIRSGLTIDGDEKE